MRGTRPMVPVTLLALAACRESEPVTKPPDPPLDTADWVAIWSAVLLAAVGWVAMVIIRMVRRRTPTGRRLTAGALFVAAGLASLSVVAYTAATTIRTASIVGWDNCRSVPVDERPEQVVQLECVPGDSLDLSWIGLVVVAALFGSIAVLSLLNAAMLLRSPARPWFPAILATAAAAAFVALSISAVGNDTSLAEWGGLAGGVVGAVVAGACSWFEVISRPSATGGRVP